MRGHLWLAHLRGLHCGTSVAPGRLPGRPVVTEEPRWLAPLRGHHHVMRRMRPRWQAPLRSHNHVVRKMRPWWLPPPPEGPPLPYGACAGRPSRQARDEEGGSPPCGEHGAWPAPSASGPAPPRDDRCCGRKRRGPLSPCPFPNCAERTYKMRDPVTGCHLHPVFRRSVPLGEEAPGCGSGYVSGWRSSS